VLKLTGYIALEGFDRVVQLKEVKDDLRDDLRNVQNKEISNTERDERERDREFKDIMERERKEFSSLEKDKISFLLPEKSLNSLNEGGALRNGILKSGSNGPLSEEILLKALKSIQTNHGRLTPFYLSMAAKHFGGDIPPKESEVWMRNVGCVEAVPNWVPPDISQ
jgi:predicted ATP-dependent endonuclease of OLD family